jgi:hypothetical protein
MAGFSDSVETSIMAMIFTATAWANYADNAASSPQTQLAWGLHTGDPTDVGNMLTNEIGYTSYARASTNRATGAGGMVVSGNSASPVSDINFPLGTGGTGTASFFSVGKTGGGSAPILMAGVLSPSLLCGNGVQPVLTNSTVLTID